MASASALTPGVGTKFPTRNTPSSASVNSTRLRRSVTANRFFSAFSIFFHPQELHLPRSGVLLLRFVLRGFLRHLQHFGRAAGRRDLLCCLAAELVRAHGQVLRDVTAGE